MVSRVRTIDFLPEIFRTSTNEQFLAATLDQITAQPNTMKIQGFIGSKFGYGINSNDGYLVEGTKARTDYQLEPSVIFLKKDTSTAVDLLTYSGIIDSVKLEGGSTTNHSDLFTNQFYSWDSLVDLDKVINFNQYFWLPDGPESVEITTDDVYSEVDFVATVVDNTYTFIADGSSVPGANPTLTLLRGGTYTFAVNQTSAFWIQGSDLMDGTDAIYNNLDTRDIFGLDVNGITNGKMTFKVPTIGGQSYLNFPSTQQVDLVTTLKFDDIYGMPVSALGNIDGLSSFDGKTLLFYGNPPETQGFLSTLFDYNNYENSPADYEGGKYTDLNKHLYLITYVGDPLDPIIRLTEYKTIVQNDKIKVVYGTAFANRSFVADELSNIFLVPYISSTLDTLYYRDGTDIDRVGKIRIIENTNNNVIQVDTDIIGKKSYTSPNGVTLTNGIRVNFTGVVYPTTYSTDSYYVEGVGTSIVLLPVTNFIVPEQFSDGYYVPYDTTDNDIKPYDGINFVPKDKDYLTINRNSLSKNAWSRSNRWFHIDVLTVTAKYNKTSTISLSALNDPAYRAKRPILEFYPNLALYDSGTVGKAPVDYIDILTTDPFGFKDGMPICAGAEDFYIASAGASVFDGARIIFTNATDPDVRNKIFVVNYVYTGATANTYTIALTIAHDGNIVESDQTVILRGGGIAFTHSLQFRNAAYVPWLNTHGIWNTVNNSPVFDRIFTLDVPASGTYVLTGACDDYGVIYLDGAKVLTIPGFSQTYSSTVYLSSGKHTLRIHGVNTGGPGSIGLTVEGVAGTIFATDDRPLNTNAGEEYVGVSIYYNGTDWIFSQQKQYVNQPPKFDIFDKNNISLGNKDYYLGSSFEGSTLFQYALGTGTDDAVLGFPLKYSALNNLGDIAFEVSLNTDTFSYVENNNPLTKNVNLGYVFNYTAPYVYDRNIGWQTAIGESFQYQVFDKMYVSGTPQFVLDVALKDSTTTPWPVIHLYVDNSRVSPSMYTVSVTANSTVITLKAAPAAGTPVQALAYSDQVSKTAYYQIPSNLGNNPFNTPITNINVGDIRGHYKSICNNHPGIIGAAFGPNNYRDLGNIVPYGTRVIQSSSSLVPAAAFMRNQNYNLFNALTFNSHEYIKFKTLLVDAVAKTDYYPQATDAQILDDVLEKISSTKSLDGAFFWSDMIPSKSTYTSNSYTFVNYIDTTSYPLTRTYDFTTANYYSVLVYLTRMVNGVSKTVQFMRGVDYVVSATEPKVTVSTDLLPNDTITIHEYDQTYGSYVPNTPSKLGLYPTTIPKIKYDEAYATPTYFIVGHDGSLTKLYGIYNDGYLQDFRDRALFEFEKRIYNNIKTSNVIPVTKEDVFPNQFRKTDYVYSEIFNMYSEYFLNWVGQNRIDYKTQYYSATNEFTYNYNKCANKIDYELIKQGSWRGIYMWLYDTTTPNTTPWEMLGFTDKPTWWETRYGAAPYTSDNLLLWTDLANGFNYNGGTSSVIIPNRVRDGLLYVLPVDSNGDLVSPLQSTVLSGDKNSYNRDWKVGDVGPAEYSYLNSSSWPFDLMRILALTKPARFFTLGIDVDKYEYNYEFNQYLQNVRLRAPLTALEIYGDGTPVHSYVNWIVDYVQQTGMPGKSNISDWISNLDVRLTYRLAGFSDKDLLKFYVEKGSPNSKNNSLLIPDESYNIVLYNNQPFDSLIYSSVIIQKTSTGYKIYGNSQNKAYFKTATPIMNGNYETYSVGTVGITISKDFSDTETLVAYGTEFYSIQAVCEFMINYSRSLLAKGMVFNEIENGLTVNWEQMVLETLYWSQSGWEVGSIINVNPGANTITVNKDNTIVQPLTLHNQNYVLNQNLVPIQTKDMKVYRNGTEFSITALTNNDAFSFLTANLSNYEHAVIFDNTTVFNDIIFRPVTGLRQQRIYTKGVKTADWNGQVDAAGFILNQDNIEDWKQNSKYTKGVIVKYKNSYWTSTQVIQPSIKFDETIWVKTEYESIQKGLLPNASTRAYESTLYYDPNNANLESDANLLSFSLIGYRPRDYLAAANLDDVTEIKLFQNMIKRMGTSTIANAVNGIVVPQGTLSYDIYENWAIKTSEFGGALNKNYIEFKLDESKLTGNPAIVGLTNGTHIAGVEQQVPMYDLTNYGQPVSDMNVLPTIDSVMKYKLPSAGYVNIDDVRIYSYNFATLPNANYSINSLYKNQYIWLADYNGQWRVYTPVALGADTNTPILLTGCSNNLNGTVTLTFDYPHGLKKTKSFADIFAIINFDSRVDGYYTVLSVIDANTITVELNLTPDKIQFTGSGILAKFVTQRVGAPRDAATLPVSNNEFVKTKLWADADSNGDWAVYQKSLNYKLATMETPVSTMKFGSSALYHPDLGYFVGDSGTGTVYNYGYNDALNTFSLRGSISGSGHFGTTMAKAGDIVVISDASDTNQSSNVYIYQVIINNSVAALILQQAITDVVYRTGDSIALSGDKKWLYISSLGGGDAKVLVYQLDQFYTHTSTTYTVLANVLPGSVTAFVNGNHTSTFTPGKRVSFSSTSYAPTYIVAARSYNATTAKTTITLSTPLIDAVTAGATIYLSTTNYSVMSAIGAPTGVTYVDKFGYSIATNYDGSKIFVGAPKQDYQGTYANYSSSMGYAAGEVIKHNNVYYKVTINILGSENFDQIITSLSALTDTGYTYVYERTIQNFEQQYTSPAHDIFHIRFPLIHSSSGTAVSRNGVELEPGFEFDVVDGVLVLFIGLNVGDLITVSNNDYIHVQTLNNYLTNFDINANAQFGTSVSTNTFGTEVIVGSPFFVNANGQEGAALRFTNEGKRFGTLTGITPANVLSEITILLNGHSVRVLGLANDIAKQINDANIPNVFATSTLDGKLNIGLRDKSLAPINDLLNLGLLTYADSTKLGIELYTRTQLITDVHSENRTEFGSVVKFNEYNSVVISAPVSTRFMRTAFEFSDDENYDNDTLFDNNFTQFIDGFYNAGAVYMYDYMGTSNESLTNIGAYAFAQSVNDETSNYNKPRYGSAIFFGDYKVMIGAANSARVYHNKTNKADWAVYRTSGLIVDINRIESVQLYDNITNDPIDHLDYIDPLQGRLLGGVSENLDYITSTDPAGYNGPSSVNNLTWTSDHTGKVWLDTSKLRFMNYHQNDISYNSKYWGKTFPGSTVTIYTWVESNQQPAFYTGVGTPYDIEKYSSTLTLNTSGNLIAKYFYWVRNVDLFDKKLGKTLPTRIMEQYIADPQKSGISYIAPFKPSVFGIYNSIDNINSTHTSIHIGFDNGQGEDPSHSEYQLIRDGYSGDFLTGLPSASNNYGAPVSLYNTLLDSLAGVDHAGAIVPDPYLPKLMQKGILTRPRQSFFTNRLKALENYLTYANNILAAIPMSESSNSVFLHTVGTTNPSNREPYYYTTDAWSYVDWWATGYDSKVKSAFAVPKLYDLAPLTPKEGLIVGVLANSDGKYETYIYTSGNWVRIGLQKGTIAFSDKLWDYSANRIGFGDSFFDTVPYDSYPNEETKNVVRALTEEIFINDLITHRNKSLILLLEYIQSEDIDSQNYLPWMNKTSMIDVSHNVRELKPYEKFQRDNEDFLRGYLNEVKPYHVVIKEFYLRYTGTDNYVGNISDFDLPAVYNSAYSKYITPELSRGSTDSISQYLENDSIWNTNTDFKNWHDNYGLTISGKSDFVMTTLKVGVKVTSSTIVVFSAHGFPVQGTITIDNEKIGYTGVDRYKGILSGLTRGVHGTAIVDHAYSSDILIDLPGVIVLNSARGYMDPPTVRAYIDTTKYPAPKVEAKLRAVMALDKVIGIEVLNAGEGYATSPTIIIQPSIIATFTNADVNYINNTISVSTALFATGDCIKYTTDDSTTAAGLYTDSHYFVRVIGAHGTGTVIALYIDYPSSLIDTHRVEILQSISTGTGTLSLTPKVQPMMDTNVVRGLTTVMKFDRTTYRSLVKIWTPGDYYAAGFDTDSTASSSTQLYAAKAYEDLPKANKSNLTKALFQVTVVLMDDIVNEGKYIPKILNPGTGYHVNDTISIPGTDINSGWTDSENICKITVTAIDGHGGVAQFTVTGVPGTFRRVSLQGALFPIVNVRTLNDQAVVAFDYSVSGLVAGQIKGMNMYFYTRYAPYLVKDSEAVTTTGGTGAKLNVYRPKFTPTNVYNQYMVTIYVDPANPTAGPVGGEFYSVGDVITVTGDNLGGSVGINNATITITQVSEFGAIEAADVTGTAQGGFRAYYVDPISDTELKVYNDIHLTVPTPGPAVLPPAVPFKYMIGDYAFVANPALSTGGPTYLFKSYVSYQNNIYMCKLTNNDAVFQYDKWEQI